jgi:hypothetical protein
MRTVPTCPHCSSRTRASASPVDNVGTGLISLAHLGSLPLTELKVDGRFVRSATAEPGARAVLQSALDLATGLGLRLVAAGVENQRTWDLLLELGYDRGQGYFLSPPLPPQDLHAWLVQRTSVHTAGCPMGADRGWRAPVDAEDEPVRRDCAALARLRFAACEACVERLERGRHARRIVARPAHSRRGRRLSAAGFEPRPLPRRVVICSLAVCPPAQRAKAGRRPR